MYLLALETGIGGGSLSIFDDDKLLDFRLGGYHFGRSEFFIDTVSKIFMENDLERSNLGKILYSGNPGSHTGLKIGASLAKGLGLALDVPVKAKDLFASVFVCIFRPGMENVRIILPLSKTILEWKVFDGAGNCLDFGQVIPGSSVGVDEKFLPKQKFMPTYMPLSLLPEPEVIRGYFGVKDEKGLFDLGANLSKYLGLSENGNFGG